MANKMRDEEPGSHWVSGEDDVEGHRATLRDAEPSAKSKAQDDDDDVEGHRAALRDAEPGILRPRATDDDEDDTEGHRFQS